MFEQWVAGDQPNLNVLHVVGSGGAGKTTLLRAYAERAEAAGIAVVAVDLRALEGGPADLDAELRSHPRWQDEGPLVLLVDTYERAGAMDRWLREELLPSLSTHRLVVLAGRRTPSPSWTDDPGWRHLVRVLRLRNLDRADSRALLRAAGVSDDRAVDAVAQAAYGHPLALSLLADVVRQQPDVDRIDLRGSPTLLAALVQRFVDDVPSRLHRRALQICAHAWLTTEDLLRLALEIDDAAPLYHWLASLSFVERARYGLFPHDIARDVLDGDLRQRDPSGYQDVHRRVFRAAIAMGHATAGRARQRAAMTILYGHRSHPVTSAYFDQRSLGRSFLEPASPADVETLADAATAIRGPEEGALVQRWASRQPGSIRVVRDGGSDPIGMFLTVRLDLLDIAAGDADADPIVAGVIRAIARNPLRPGDAATVTRPLDLAQPVGPSRTMGLGPILTMNDLMTLPHTAWDVLCFPDTGHVDGLMAFIDYTRLDRGEVEMDRQRWALFGRDYRHGGFENWLELLAQRGVGWAAAPTTPPPEDLALPHDVFADAVRQALKDLQRPDRLATNPLVRSRLVREVIVTGDDRDGGPADALVEAVLRAAEQLAASPRDAKGFRALDRTYLRPAATQEAAAEVLGLPFSTYRRHLTRGVERLTEILWKVDTLSP